MRTGRRVQILLACALALGLSGGFTLAATPSSTPVQLLHAQGKPTATAYVFFNSLCSGCRTELPEVRVWLTAHPRYEPVGVGFREQAAVSAHASARYGLPIRYISDPQGRFSYAHGVHVLVRVVVIRNGRVIARYQPPYTGV